MQISAQDRSSRVVLCIMLFVAGWLAGLSLSIHWPAGQSSGKAISLVPPSWAPAPGSGSGVQPASSAYLFVNISSRGVSTQRIGCAGTAAGTVQYRTDGPFKLIDAVIINNELDVLNIRLLEYYDMFDFFIITESPVAFSGKAKPLHFGGSICSQFARYTDKLVHVVLDSSLRRAGMGAWEWEDRHRSTVKDVGPLLSLGPRDLIMTSDVDELPTAAAVLHGANSVYNAMATDKYPVVEFNLLLYYFSLYHHPLVTWNKHVKIVPYSILNVTSIDGLRKSPPYKHSSIIPIETIDHSGIHVSYFFTPEQLVTKIRSFSHFDEERYKKSDAEVIDYFKKLIATNANFKGQKMEARNPPRDGALYPFKPQTREALLRQTAYLHAKQMQ